MQHNKIKVFCSMSSVVWYINPFSVTDSWRCHLSLVIVMKTSNQWFNCLRQFLWKLIGVHCVVKRQAVLSVCNRPHLKYTWWTAGMFLRTPWSRPRPGVFEAKAKARSFRIKAMYAYEILHDYKWGMGARRHGQGGAHAPPWKIPNVFKNMLMLQS